MQKISAAAFNDTKPHYELLDGLRGVAAIMVIFYHIFLIIVISHHLFLYLSLFYKILQQFHPFHHLNV